MSADIRVRLARVKYMPQVLEPHVLYVADEFNIAAHLCACGCGTKVRTPLGPAEWTVTETRSGPTLRPSIGNWQLPCRSHYLITAGDVVWAPAWTDDAIASGREQENDRRREYYAGLAQQPRGLGRRLRRWLEGWFFPLRR